MMTDSHDVRRVCLRVGQAGASGAVALPILPPCFKFTITSTMIQLLNLKGMFRGEAGDDENQHRMNFVAICKSRKIPRLMDEVAKNNRARHTMKAEVEDLGVTFEVSAEKRRREEERDQDMNHMRTHMVLLTKHIMEGSEKVNVVGTPNR
ncbi:hypothetical protein KY284_036048 [Solanum tuberosum]|nr:hypothetical protein KY284_036048 [Solanum tuberosum]